jgi:hypothetical protein
MHHDGVRQVHDPVAGIKKAEPELLLLSLELERLAVAAQREEHVPPHHVRKSDVAGHEYRDRCGGRLHRGRPGRSVGLSLRERDRPDMRIAAQQSHRIGNRFGD